MTSSRLRFALVGGGAMGSLHARIISSADRADLHTIVDPDAAAGRGLAERHGAQHAPELVDVGAYDAVVVASPTATHPAIAEQVLDAGVPLFVEKPLAHSYDEASRIVEQALRGGVPLLCGFVERFNPAFRTAMAHLGDVRHIRGTRHSPYVERMRGGIADDLAIHDIDLALRIAGEAPMRIVGTFSCIDDRSDDGCEDIADINMTFESGAQALLTASRVAQRKERALAITCADRQIEVDLLRQDVTVYRHVEITQLEDRSLQQQTIMEIPPVMAASEPLQEQFEHFLALIDGDADAAAEAATLLPAHLALAQARAVADAGGGQGDAGELAEAAARVP